MFYHDRRLAHRFLFAHRHPHESPPFHGEMIDDWHSKHPRVLDLVFREGAKSTIAEEAVCIQAGFQEFKNALFVGSNKERAMERLHAVRKEIEGNERFIKVFGDIVGNTWADDELVFSRGHRILALGRGQALRGTKYEDIRPDLIFGDDLEEREEVWKKEGRLKVFYWFTRDLIPAGDTPNLRVRIAATPLDPDALPMRLKRSKEWKTHTYPIYYLDPETGEPTSSWPSRYSIESVLAKEQSYRESGDISGFNAEYMCMAESPESKKFKESMFVTEPRVRTYQAISTMHDPARTVGPRSATTGFAAWSWQGPKLLVWKAWAKKLMPDEIINSLFETAETLSPVVMGFEEDGLNEWAMQQIRTAQLQRRIRLPVRAMKAPRGKLSFIEGLQPSFIAKEVIFMEPMDELREQLLGFPSGDIDAPNALAYALRMRPGAPIYEGFSDFHIAENIRPVKSQPVWLCLHATRISLAATAVQVFDGCVRVFADYVREGDPGQSLAGLVADAKVEFGTDVKLRLRAPPLHFSMHHNVGLAQAARRAGLEIESGADPVEGRPAVDRMLNEIRHAQPRIMVTSSAHWTLNAFNGGYCRMMEKNGILSDEAEEGEYRVLMEGFESFCGLLAAGFRDGETRARYNAQAADGRPYRSIVGGSYEPKPLKSEW